MSETATARVAEGWRIVLPADFRRELGVSIGDQVVLRLENRQIVMVGKLDALRAAQKVVTKRITNRRRSLVQELISERRRESARE